MPDSWRRKRNELEKRIEKGNRDELPILRFQIEELNWLINEGNNQRTRQKIEFEYKGIVAQKARAEGTERLRLEMKASILEQSVPYLARFLRGNVQMSENLRKNIERIEQVKSKFEDTRLVDSFSEQTEIEIKIKNNVMIHVTMIYPSRKKSEKLATIIVIHDK